MNINKLYRFISLDLWGNVPAIIQKKMSAFYTRLYTTSFSRHFIGPYSAFHYRDPQYLKKFIPASGASNYKTFQDFFSRKLKEPLSSGNNHSWPCEGLLCEYGRVGNLPEVNVKKQRRHLRTIFGQGGSLIPDHYYFSNIFLHNKDYHRIHSPVTGRISRIEHIPGELVLLRPWIYKEDPSHPALRNERYNVDITDDAGKTWFISIVGGPAVGTIILEKTVKLDFLINTGEELATFLLGSTCCMASPVRINKNIGEMVEPGIPL